MKSYRTQISAILSLFLLVVSLSSILVVSTWSSGVPPTQTFSRVILFSWDGVQYNHLMELYNAGSLTNLKKLLNETKLPILKTLITDTYTATDWAHPSMLSGFGRGPVKGALDGVTVWENIEVWNSSWITGALAGKAKFADVIFPYAWSDIDVRYAGDVYAGVIADKAIQFIQNYGDSSFFLFVHFRDPDSAGHSYGENSPQYNNAIIECDTQIGRILGALDSEGIRNSTAIIVTTDHGFLEGGKDHGSSPWPAGNVDCYTVWVASSHGTVDPDEAANNFWDLNDVAPTIYSVIGITDYTTRYPYVRGFALWERCFDVRDVAITNIQLSTSEAANDRVYIDVFIENQGNYTEIPTVSAYYDNNTIGTKTLVYPDAPMFGHGRDASTRKITFTWDIRNVPPGIYTISVNVSVVAAGGTSQPSVTYKINETDTADNTNFARARVSVHDVVIINLTVSNQNPSLGETIYINVTSKNQGNFTENFNVNLYYTRIDDPLVGTQNVTLDSGEDTTLTFEWTPNMTGIYEILANATIILNDIDPADNTRTTTVYVGYGGSNPGSHNSESLNGLHIASLLFAMFASLIALAFPKNRKVSLCDLPASILEQNLRGNFPDGATNMWQDQMRQLPI